MPARPAMLLWALLAVTADAAGPVFVARTTAGKEVKGPLVRLDDWSVELGEGVRRRLADGNLLSLRREGAAFPEFPTDEHLVLGNGDRVPVQELRLDDEKFYFRHRDLGGGKE